MDQAVVSDGQNCGNILAGVGPFALERGLVSAQEPTTAVSIRMVNTGQEAVATVSTPSGRVSYSGEASIDGVPGHHAPVTLAFRDTAGASCGALLPTGRIIDVIDGVECTLIDNGMPCVVLRASDVGVSGYETKTALDSNVDLKRRLQNIRLKAGPLMNLGQVEEASVPKMMLVASPRDGGTVGVRSFIPHVAHASIGVLGAVTVATACLIPGTVSHSLAAPSTGARRTLGIEHPTGVTQCVLEVDDAGRGTATAMLRTARKLMDGVVFA